MTDRPKEYTEVRNEVTKNDSRCCGPIALALVTGISGRRAQNALAKQGRRRHKGSRTHQILAAVKDLGFTVRRLEKMEKRCKTVRSLGRQVSGSRVLLAFTARHVLAVKDGQIQDWTVNRLHRITAIYLIEK